MKFTATATINDEIPEVFNAAEWIEAMIKELDKRNMTNEELFALEMTLAREGSKAAVEEAKIDEARVEERQIAKKKLAKERQLSEKKLAKEKQLAEERLAKEKQLAEDKRAKEKQKSAKQLLALKTMSDEQIALIIGLPLERIQQLKKELNPNKK